MCSSGRALIHIVCVRRSNSKSTSREVEAAHRLDIGKIGDRVGKRRDIDNVQEQTGTLQMAQKLVPEARAFCRALDQARNVGNHEAAAGAHPHHAKIRRERREWVIGDLRLRVGHRRNRGGFVFGHKSGFASPWAYGIYRVGFPVTCDTEETRGATCVPPGRRGDLPGTFGASRSLAIRVATCFRGATGWTGQSVAGSFCWHVFCELEAN